MQDTFLASVVGFAVCLGGCATAPQHPPVASTPVPQAGDAAFKLLDTNGDGYLSVSELEQQHAVGLLRDMQKADANADGKVSLPDYEEWCGKSERAPPAPSMVVLNRSSAPLK